MNRAGKVSSLLACLFSLIVAPPLLDAASLDINEAFKARRLCTAAEYLEDRDGSLTIGDVSGGTAEGEWKKSEKSALGFGFTQSVYWIRFNIANRGSEDVAALIQQEYPLIDKLEMWVFRNGKQAGHFVTGDTLPFSERPYINRTFVFPVTARADTVSSFYLRYKSESSMSIVLNAWSPAEFDRLSTDEERALMLYYGIMLTMVIYNLFIFLSLRKMEYIYYVLFILGFLVFTMTQNGTAYQFLWPSFPAFANACIPPVLCFLAIFAIIFSASFLDMKAYAPVLNRVLLVFAAVEGLFFIACIILPYRYGMTGSAVLALVIVVSTLMAGIHVGRKGNRNARFYLLAVGFFLLGSFIYLLKSFGVLPSGVVTDWSLQIGSAAMVLLLSLALADRIRTTTTELESTQRRLEKRTVALEGVMATAREMSAELSQIGGEQEQISRRFSEMSQEQATMSEQMSPEEVVSMLNSYFSYITEPVMENHGVINKFIGDAVMAIFTPHLGSDNHVEDAINAALGMRQRLAELNASGRLKMPVRFGVGLNTGNLVAGNIGTEKRFEYTVIGDTVNVASRMESLSKSFDHDIILSQATVDQIPSGFAARLQLEKTDPVQIKGKSQPAAVYKLLGRA